MEIIIYLFVAIAAIVLIFLILEHPYHIVAIYFFMLLYQFNIETPLPVDFRGIILLILFVRLYIFDKENIRLINNRLIKNKYFLIIFIFLISILFIPIIESKSVFGHVREIILSIIAISIGFISVKEEVGKKAIVIGLLFAGFFSTIDLIFTFSTTGGLKIIKVIDLFLGKTTLLNHNYPGFLASLSLLSLYLFWKFLKLPKVFLIGLSLFFGIGIVISTSRSAILGLIIPIIIVTFLEPSFKHNIKRIVPVILVVAISLVGFFFTYNIFYSSSAEKTFIDNVYYRLYEEPIEILTGNVTEYGEKSGKKITGSITFRAERWQNDFNKYLSLDLFDQLFGLGPKGFLKIIKKNYSWDGNVYEYFAPHNGYLIILIERGLFGLLLFFILLIGLSVSSINNIENNFNIIYLIISVSIYSFGQNAELTSAFVYLMFGAVIGNLVQIDIGSKHQEEDKFHDPYATLINNV